MAAFLALAAPAYAQCGGVERFPARRDVGPGPPPLAVGDSVMLGAAERLAGAGFDVDVRGCRQMSEGVRTLRSYRRDGRLPRVVVMALGANWTIATREIRAALRVLGHERVLGLVTPRESGNRPSADADTVRAAGSRWPGRVQVLDWVAYSDGHPEWFAHDGLHLATGGARALTRLLQQAFAWIGQPPAATPQPAPAPPSVSPGGGVPAP